MIVKYLAKQPGLLKSFWHNHIDKSLTSSFKTAVKFTLLDLIIVNSSATILIPQLLTKNVVKTMIRSLSSVDSSNEEEAVILTMLEHLVLAVKNNSDIQRPILKSLLKDPGTIRFDQITGNNPNKIYMSQTDITLGVYALLG